MSWSLLHKNINAYKLGPKNLNILEIASPSITRVYIRIIHEKMKVHIFN